MPPVTVQLNCPLFHLPNYNFSQYSKHLRLFHEHEQNFIIACHIPDCKRSFKTVLSYQKHNLRNHGTFYVFNLNDGFSQEPSQETNEKNIESTECDEGEEMVVYSNNVENSYDVEAFKKHFALILLNIREKHLLPDTVQESLTSEINFLINHCEEYYRSSIEKGLTELCACPSESETLSKLLSEASVFHQHMMNF